MNPLVAFLISYLIGSIPTAYIIGKIYGIDIRDYGSGNMGATNVYRILGKKPGIITFIIDLAKGFIPTYLAMNLFQNPLVIIGCGFFSVIGHIFTVFLNFKGGKGVATSTGVFLAIATAQLIAALIVFFIILKIRGYVSLATLTATTIFLILSLISSMKVEFKYFSLIISITIFLTHIPNIKRLLKGQELKYNGR